MRARKPLEAVRGTYTALPHALLDSTAFHGAGHPAKALLLELLRQHNGRNNGRLQLTGAWLSSRGWKSADVIQRAIVELMERGLVVRTKQGGLNIGPSLYALTWLPVTNFVGLDISSSTYHPGAWTFMDKLPIPQKQQSHTARRNSTTPGDGVAKAPATPPDGAKKAVFGEVATPGDGDNEYIPLPPACSSASPVSCVAASEQQKPQETAPEKKWRPAIMTRC
jgi:hypothetical protein